MAGDLPDYYFRIRDNGAVVFKVDTENRQRRIEMEEIATVNVKNGNIKPHGDQALSISEKKKIVEYHKEYETSGKKEGIPRETLTANQISSDDIKPITGNEAKQK